MNQHLPPRFLALASLPVLGDPLHPEDLAKPISFLSYLHLHSHLLPAYKPSRPQPCSPTRNVSRVFEDSVGQIMIMSRVTTKRAYDFTSASDLNSVWREHLEFLEVNLCAKDLSGGGGFLDGLLNPQGVNAHILTDMSATLLSTIVTTVTTTSSHLRLPLRSLEITLDNATFHVLSTWQMPQLQNLSVVSADLLYTGEGFAQFFEVHGGKTRQLELGHSLSGAIEEFWLTAPPHAAAGGQGNGGGFGVGGVGECADAEWNWQNPDWIAPHILLPSHSTLQFIGVCELEKHNTESLERLSNLDAEHLAKGGQLYNVNLEETGTLRGDDAFLMLVKQFRGGLLSRVKSYIFLA
ncbi:hypothetical protein EST38_g4449 [Candolleomyces aberdarensis]|uniref:Uncharacterized protein n=1 Tax=Candolleomyces aberdarensis TaxID=2316362 RepID=A0A4Q2DMZ4_9AGAR|nr:hypothetical protein EST38_g4449 [Candolleomyces aberdarensis]